MSTKSIPTVLALIVSATLALEAQQAPLPIQDGQLLQLWSGPAPGALGAEASDIPAVTVFLPRTMTANTPAILVCPGGGYVNLAMNHEGRQVASYLNSLGIAAFVLRSRLGPRYHHPTELGDAQRAIRMLRAHAVEWRLDPARVGIAGFSAGGHLAMTASTHFDAGSPDAGDIVDRANSRPDFAVLGYPVRGLDASGIEEQSVGHQSGAGTREERFRRAVRDETDATNISVSHRRRHHRTGGKQRPLLPRFTQSGRIRRIAHFRKRPTRRGAGERRCGVVRVVEAARQLAARARSRQVVAGEQ